MLTQVQSVQTSAIPSVMVVDWWEQVGKSAQSFKSLVCRTSHSKVD